MTGWKRAGRCLEGHAAETAVPVLAELFIAVIMLIAGGFLQHCLTEAGLLCGGGGIGLTDLWLPGCLLAGMLAQTPLMVTRTRLLAELTGVLTEDDRGFLGCCTDWWLWLRLIRVRLRLAGMLLLSVLPSFLLLTAARTVLLLSVGREEAILPLMTAVHLLLAGIGTVLLPLRVTAAAAAMPLCFLKNPHQPAECAAAGAAPGGHSAGDTLSARCSHASAAPARRGAARNGTRRASAERTKTVGIICTKSCRLQNLTLHSCISADRTV